MVLRELVQKLSLFLIVLKSSHACWAQKKKSARPWLGVKIPLGLRILRGENGDIKKWCRHHWSCQEPLFICTTVKPQSAAKTRCCNLTLIFNEMELNPGNPLLSDSAGLQSTQRAFCPWGPAEGESNIFTSVIWFFSARSQARTRGAAIQPLEGKPERIH